MTFVSRTGAPGPWGFPMRQPCVFSFTAPLFCGTQIVKCVWSNAAGRAVLVTRVITTNCVEPDIRVTISWDDKGRDWEAHLVKPNGRINDNLTDCTWTPCLGTGPDWGVAGDLSDNAHKDVDNTGPYGPENIFLSKPESGRFTVLIEHWGVGQPSAGGGHCQRAGPCDRRRHHQFHHATRSDDRDDRLAVRRCKRAQRRLRLRGKLVERLQRQAAHVTVTSRRAYTARMRRQICAALLGSAAGDPCAQEGVARAATRDRVHRMTRQLFRRFWG